MADKWMEMGVYNVNLRKSGLHNGETCQEELSFLFISHLD